MGHRVGRDRDRPGARGRGAVAGGSQIRRGRIPPRRIGTDRHRDLHAAGCPGSDALSRRDPGDLIVGRHYLESGTDTKLADINNYLSSQRDLDLHREEIAALEAELAKLEEESQTWMGQLAMATRNQHAAWEELDEQCLETVRLWEAQEARKRAEEARRKAEEGAGERRQPRPRPGAVNRLASRLRLSLPDKARGSVPFPGWSVLSRDRRSWTPGGRPAREEGATGEWTCSAPETLACMRRRAERSP